MKISPHLIVTIFIQFQLISKLNGQDMFKTLAGTIEITSEINDTIAVFTSHNLIVSLNYENAQVKMQLDLGTLTSGLDTLDKKISQYKNSIIIFDGKLGIDYINTEDHPEQDFNVNGLLIYNNNKNKIEGTGKLIHIYGNFYACLLNVTFHLNLSNLNYKLPFNNMSNDIQIEIIDAVLKKEND
jgi:hypothetical protein